MARNALPTFTGWVGPGIPPLNGRLKDWPPSFPFFDRAHRPEMVSRTMDVRREDLRTRTRWQVSNIRQRVRLVCFLLVALYMALAGRLVFLQIVKHDYYFRIARQIREHLIPLPAQRGEIVDRNGAPLAINIEVGQISADPTQVSDPTATGEALASCLPNVDAGAIATDILSMKGKLNASGKPVRAVSLATVPFANLKALEDEMREERAAHLKNPATPDQLAGIYIDTHWVRSYPNGDLAAQVLGFVSKGPGDKMTGVYGIEKSCDPILAGTDGYSHVQTDVDGHVLPGTETDHVAPHNGQNVTLTIDSYLQGVAQAALAKSVKAHHAQSGCVVVIDRQTGEILALANLPTFDPNNLTGSAYQQWDDRAVSDLYEPGSTLKTLTLSAVLDSQGLDMMNRTIYCSGEMQIGGHTIHCAKDPPKYGKHGLEDMRNVLENSCNIGAAQFALGLGADKLYQYEVAFGLTDRPDCGLPGAQFSRLESPEEKPWSKIQLANIAFGQGISMTPLQLASVYATIANDGRRVYPHIIAGQPVGPPVQVVKPEVAQAMLSMLQSVVTDGTGEPAQIADFTIAGKTGSAQVAEHGHYGDEYVGSFCGVVPVTNPRLVILCAIFKPQGVHWGAVVAAPVVHDVAKAAMAYLKTQPDAPGSQDYNDPKRKRDTAAFVTIHVPAPAGEQAEAPLASGG